ncbi:uncharacterized protein HMPREF1541_10395 [Cyphellophora europaea CBS 101466]|uniref:Rhodopsin domain-containing protein n=1 Tax=Cyphellophora europaea (strain CBS 101466) TaxID=1220924 RepID=W2S7W6_CYPE1|nr:uncharacterized protein HMPREF1541_10395 [Cyphellophora europaea CBS 101466]ETN44725.1 hypothetical protein HMPREF1541_10395 [Cyphellophora europaea CBS 101466]
MHIWVNILGILTVIWIILFIGLSVFQCIPLQRAWNPMIPGKCLNIKALFIGNAVPNILTDAVMVVLPIPPVLKLRLPLSQRIAVIGIFMLGSFVCIASIYRLTTVPQLDPTNLAFTLRGAAIFGHMETAVAIMSACLPTLRPLFSKFIDAVGLSNNGNSYADKTGSKSGGRSRSSTLSSYASRKPKNEGFVVIVDDDGPRLSMKPLPQAPPPAARSSNSRGRNTTTTTAEDVPMDVIHVRQDVDIEAGREDSSSSMPTSQWSDRARGDWNRSGPPEHVAGQVRR